MLPLKSLILKKETNLLPLQVQQLSFICGIVTAIIYPLLVLHCKIIILIEVTSNRSNTHIFF